MIEEAYDCAKIFNTTQSGNQMPLGALCDTYLNVVYKKKNGPAFAVSTFYKLMIFSLPRPNYLWRSTCNGGSSLVKLRPKR